MVNDPTKRADELRAELASSTRWQTSGQPTLKWREPVRRTHRVSQIEPASCASLLLARHFDVLAQNMSNEKNPGEGRDEVAAKPKCGIVMPIAGMEGYPESHWAEVQRILIDAVSSVGFDADMVSSAADVGVILGTIVTNLHENPMVICDISGKNANVMFELGMRLAFDKPTVIVKDDQTGYPFDTAPIEHLTYRRDLRYESINEFKTKLAAKVDATHRAFTNVGPDYKSFLSHFGKYKVTQLSEREVTASELIIREIDGLKTLLRSGAFGVSTSVGSTSATDVIKGLQQKAMSVSGKSLPELKAYLSGYAASRYPDASFQFVAHVINNLIPPPEPAPSEAALVVPERDLS